MPLGAQVAKQVVTAPEQGRALLLSSLTAEAVARLRRHRALDRAWGLAVGGPLSEQAQFICSYTEYPHFHLPLFNEA